MGEVALRVSAWRSRLLKPGKEPFIFGLNYSILSGILNLFAPLLFKEGCPKDGVVLEVQVIDVANVQPEHHIVELVLRVFMIQSIHPVCVIISPLGVNNQITSHI